MLIKGVTLKNKSIAVESFMPIQQMHIKIDRISSFPPNVESEVDFNCELEYNVKIQDDEKKTLVKLQLTYYIMAQIAKDETYKQEKCADKMFNALEPLFVRAVNDMLKDTSYPALPLKMSL